MLQTFYSAEYNVEKCIEFKDNYHIEKFKNVDMSDYGILYCYNDEVLSSPFAIKVLNYDQVPSYKISEEKAKELKKVYFDPIYYEFLVGIPFKNVNDIDDWYNIFDLLYNHKNQASMYGVYQDKVPMNDFMELINEYFNVDKQTVINTFKTYETTDKYYDEFGVLQTRDVYYDEVSNSIAFGDTDFYAKGAGCDWIITDCKEEGSNLTAYYSICNVVNHDPLSNYELKVKQMDDGTFRYISCIQVD